MDFARKEGCDEVRVAFETAQGTSFEVRDMQIDCIRRRAESCLNFHFFVAGRFGAFSTNRLEKEELERFIRNGIAATRLVAEDGAWRLPDADRYYVGGLPGLDLDDPHFDAIDNEAKIALAMSACAEMTGKDARILSATSSFEDCRDASYMLASNGFEGEQSATAYTLCAQVSVQDGGSPARPEDYWYDSAPFFTDLTKKGIGDRAVQRVLAKLGQKPIASGKYTMLLDNTLSSRFLSPLIGALYGAAIQQDNSFLLNKIGERIANERVTVMDAPHIPRAFGARYFDGEGVATTPRPIISEGVLQTYFLDTYYAGKLNLPPTISSPSLLTMQGGNKGCGELLADMARGIWVTGLNGGNCNGTTGDFSYGMEGFLVENGRPVRPLSEMNITGNMLSLWQQMTEAGNDPLPVSSWRIPSLLFEGVDFSGC
ncbi:MAG: TldD/PmbA family protein [Tannerellaceae bacterium]|nr:TldD/PmbA family protein [Tannerellaceae bacterium]